MNYLAEPVTSANFADLWPLARGYFVGVADRTYSPALPEEVFAAWQAGDCTVCVLRSNTAVVGAVAMHRTEHAAGCAPELWVWALGTEPGMPREFFAWITEHLQHVARDTGLARVSMRSNRMGWGRLLAPLGWEPVRIEYAIEVNHG